MFLKFFLCGHDSPVNHDITERLSLSTPCLAFVSLFYFLSDVPCLFCRYWWMCKQHCVWQPWVLWQHGWLFPLPLLSGLSGPTGWARVCGWVFGFHSVSSPHRVPFIFSNRTEHHQKEANSSRKLGLIFFFYHRIWDCENCKCFGLWRGRGHQERSVSYLGPF